MFFRPNYTPSFPLVTIVFQSSPIRPPTHSGLDRPTNSVVTFLSPISSHSKKPSNPASPDETPASPLQTTNNPTTTVPDVASSSSTGLQFSISLPKTDQSKTTEKLPPFHSLLSDARPLLFRPNHLKLRPDQCALGRQHRREHYTKSHKQNKTTPLRSEFTIWSQTKILQIGIIFWDSRRHGYTIQSTSLPSQRLVVPPQAITAFPR